VDRRTGFLSGARSIFVRENVAVRAALSSFLGSTIARERRRQLDGAAIGNAGSSYCPACFLKIGMMGENGARDGETTACRMRLRRGGRRGGQQLKGAQATSVQPTLPPLLRRHGPSGLPLPL